MTPHRGSEVMLSNVINIKGRVLFGERQVDIGTPVRHCFMVKEAVDGRRDRKKQVLREI